MEESHGMGFQKQHLIELYRATKGNFTFEIDQLQAFSRALCEQNHMRIDKCRILLANDIYLRKR